MLTGNLKLFNIYYGDFSQSGSHTAPLLDYLAEHLGSSSWYNILSSYYYQAAGSPVRRYVNGTLTFTGSVNIFPTARNVNITVNRLRRALVTELFNKGVVVPREDTIYVIIFRGDFHVNASGKSWLSDWCGLHSKVVLSNSLNISYAVVGDLSAAPANAQGACAVSQPYPNGFIGPDSAASVYAHEVAEVITDPTISVKGWTFNYPNAIRPSSCDDYDLCECGDACAYNFTGGNIKVGAKSYSLQNVWQPGAPRSCFYDDNHSFNSIFLPYFKILDARITNFEQKNMYVFLRNAINESDFVEGALRYSS